MHRSLTAAPRTVHCCAAHGGLAQARPSCPYCRNFAVCTSLLCYYCAVATAAAETALAAATVAVDTVQFRCHCCCALLATVNDCHQIKLDGRMDPVLSVKHL
jgi:hypothetical protein